MSNDKNSPSSTRGSFPTFRRLASPSVLKVVGVVVVTLITLLALFYAVANWRGAREWNRVRATLVEQGEPLSFNELVPPLPPDEENFAMSPYFDGALDKSVDLATGEDRWRLWQKRVNENRRPDLAAIGLDVDGNWRLGERVRVVWNPTAMEAAAQEHGLQVETNQPMQMLGQFVALADAELAELAEGLRRPYSQFPIRYEDNVSALLPHLSEIKRFARLSSFRALVRLDNGDSAGATEDVLLTLQLAESVTGETILVSQLVRQAIVDYAVRVVWEGLADRLWSDAQLVTLQGALREIDVLSGYQDGMRGERIFGMDLSDILERDRNLSAYGDFVEVVSLFGEVRRRLIDYAPRGWFLHNKAFIARLHGEFSIEAVDPAAHRVHLEHVRDYDEELMAALKEDSRLFVARMVMPAVGRAAVRSAESQVAVDLAVVACALERYRLANNSYPENLAALVPVFLPFTPIDVIDGEPLRYRRTDNAFVVYSIGADETDDQGVPAFQQKHNERVWQRDEGDWAWAYSREELGLN